MEAGRKSTPHWTNENENLRVLRWTEMGTPSSQVTDANTVKMINIFTKNFEI